MARAVNGWVPATTTIVPMADPTPPSAAEPTARLGRPIGEPGVDPRIGTVVDGRYRIVSLIARGGMGRVYRAEQRPLGRMVALKVLDVGLDSPQAEEFRARFELEACTTARLTHPNTVRVFDSGSFGDRELYIVMELLEGRVLNQVIHEESPLSAHRILHIFRQVCGSLREAHQLGLIHRDLKPNNVILTRPQDGAPTDDLDFARVLDFGLVTTVAASAKDAVAASDGEPSLPRPVAGSPSYMSPEQICAEPLDGRSDIYSLGVMMYACMTGTVPFRGPDPQAIMRAHLTEPLGPLPPGCRAVTECPPLAWVVRTCLEKDPAARFADVDELVRALRQCERALRGETVGTLTLHEGLLYVDGDLAETGEVHLTVQVDVFDPPPVQPPFVRTLWVGGAVLLAMGSVWGAVYAGDLASLIVRPAPVQVPAASTALAPVSPPVAAPAATPTPPEPKQVGTRAATREPDADTTVRTPHKPKAAAPVERAKTPPKSDLRNPWKTP